MSLSMSDETPVPELNASTPEGTARQSMHDQLSQMSVQFAEDLLYMVPEVEAVAIVPSFQFPQEHWPAGIIIGRNGPLRYPAELMHMASQLHTALKHQLSQTFTVINNINEYMADQASRLASLEKAIHDREQQLAQLQPDQGNSPG